SSTAVMTLRRHRCDFAIEVDSSQLGFDLHHLSHERLQTLFNAPESRLDPINRCVVGHVLIRRQVLPVVWWRVTSLSATLHWRSLRRRPPAVFPSHDLSVAISCLQFLEFPVHLLNGLDAGNDPARHSVEF